MDTAGLKKKINQKYDAVFAGLILVLILAGILALCLGRYWIPFPDVVKVLLSRVFPVSGSWDANTGPRGYPQQIRRHQRILKNALINRAR